MSGARDWLPKLTPEEATKLGLTGPGFVGTSLSVLPASLLSYLLPDPEGTPIPGVGNVPIPLVKPMSDIYNFANLLYRGGQHVVAGDLNSSASDLPGAQATQAVTKRVIDESKRLLPPLEPRNTAERIGQGAVEMAGAMGIPFLGAGAITSLPNRAARIAADFIAPAARMPIATPVVGAGMGALVTGANEAEAAFNAKDAPLLSSLAIPDEGVMIQSSTTPPTAPPLSTIPNAAAVPSLLDLPLPTENITISSQLSNASINENDAWTWGEVAGYSAAGLAVLVSRNHAGKLLEYVTGKSKAARYEEASAPSLAHTISSPTDAGPVAPLPSNAQGGLMGLEERFVDRSARLREVNNFFADTPELAELMRGRIGLRSDEIWRADQVRNVYETGIDTRTGVSGLDLRKINQEELRLPPDQRTALDNFLLALEELKDNRPRLRNGGAVDDNARLNFRTLDDAALQRIVDDGMMNPAFVSIRDKYKILHDRVIDVWQQSGMLTVGESRAMKAAHPNFIATTDVDGRLANPANPRELTPHSGTDTSPMPVYERAKFHLEDMLNARWDNDIRVETYKNIMAGQAANPKFAKLFTDSKDATGAWVKPNDNSGIPIRVDGELRWVKINNPELRFIFQQPAHTQAALLKIPAQIAQIARSGTTQAIAAATGHVFPIANAFRSSLRMSITAPKGTATGFGDRWVQNVTGGRMSLPGGLDPTNLLGVAPPVIGFLKGVGAEGVAAVGRLLGPQANNPIVNTLRTIKGPAFTDAMAQRMQIAYQRSWRGQAKEQGVLNSAMLTSVEPAMSDFAAAGNRVSAINAAMPEIYMTKPMFVNNALGETLGNFRPHGVRMNNMFHSILGLIGDSTHTFYHGLNIKNPQMIKKFGVEGAAEMNAFNARQLTGSPGTRGTSQALRSFNAIAPWTNAMIQDYMGYTRALAQSPIRTSINAMTTLGVPILASVYSALLHGPEAINYLFNEMTNDQRSAKIPFFIPGNSVDDHSAFPVAQSERILVAPLLQAAFDIFSLESHGQDQTFSQLVMDGLTDFFGKYITTSTIDSAVAGASSSAAISMPTVLQIPLATMNRQAQVKIPSLIREWTRDDIASSRPIGDRLFPTMGGVDPRSPGYTNPGRDTNGGALTSHVGWKMLEAFLGVAGSNIHSMYENIHQTYVATNDPWQALASGATDYQMTLQDSAILGRGILWSNPQRLVAQTPLAESVNRSVDALRPLVSRLADIRGEGLTRVGGRPLPPTPGAVLKIPDDPDMRTLYLAAGQLASSLISGKGSPMQDVSDIRAQIQQLPASGQNPREIRKQHNELIRQQQVAYSNADAQINDINDRLSDMIDRQVDVTQIDWKKGVEQFQ